MLVLVNHEDVIKQMNKERSEALALLTQADKDFINANFEKRNYYKSERQHLVLFRFNVVGKKDIEKAAKRLVKLNLAHFEKNVGYTIPFLPEFYNRTTEPVIQKLTPKFKVGDKVSHKPNLYKETSGTITEVSRMYKACDKNRTIDWDGLSYVESHHDWPSWADQGTKPWVSSGNKDITYNRVDEYLIKGTWTNGQYPDFYMVWNAFTYCVTSPKMNTVFSERSLKLI